MRTKTLLAPLAAVGALSLPMLISAAPAQAADATTYQATLNPLNHQTGSGTAMVWVKGDQLTVQVKYSGLASTFQSKPFPHAQHIHINGMGQCPSGLADDKDGDGVVSTPEAGSDYGAIGASLTTSGDTSPKSALAVTRFPGGSSNDYSRTFTVSQDVLSNLQSGKAVVVVHGADPTTLPKKAQSEKSPLDSSLPLAATAPALCGTLTASQMGAMPSGPANTGGGSTAGVEDTTQIALGSAALLAALGAGAVAYRRRVNS